jgi:hypothetical protein
VSAGGAIFAVTDKSWDLSGRPVCTAIRMNLAALPPLAALNACAPGQPGDHGPDRIARNVYDAAGQRLQLREGVGTSDEGTEASWAYNLNGQVTTMIDAWLEKGRQDGLWDFEEGYYAGSSKDDSA